ncbi:Helicase associated domain protein [Paenibacillus polymyxa]|uniref:Helicase associated domain protein n=1 Tax=Paenibacillus polymyxa TaxID=1406 RepID=UPI002AB4A367|nr:Helicase associated domain protein [Paenibacillus polymyxa]MDY8023399.1 Helicase associated domain protein [Paenibacillus polymyxa]
MTTHHDIELYPHNQETYDKIIEAWKTQNRVATVQATGTGKTFLILKCLFTYPNVKKVVLAPSIHILDQLSSKVDELPNTTLLTYAKLSFMSEEDIKQLNADMIVFDEFHRCGADKWGFGVQNLLNIFTDAKLLGLTATPIRHLDNGRDMSDELFEGNVVTSLTLPQAIVKGILPMPKYISALYSFDEEINNLKDKINKSTNNDEEKDDLSKIVDGLKHKLEKSNGVPSILKKYIKNETGKFIVFCKDGKHLLEMMETVKHWFKSAKIGKEIEVYSVMSDKENNEEELIQFVENKNNDNVRLLFSIEMLNEGLHVEDVTGVILLRPTTSPIIYFQQIGRALQAGNKKQPFIFDLVNNFSSLGSNQLSEGLREAVESENNKREITGLEPLEIDKFEIYDEMHEIYDIFAEIEDRLNDDWDAMFERYKSGERGKRGTKLERWVNVQRKSYKRGILIRDRVEKLESIGFIWIPHNEIWMNNFELIIKYKETYGDCNVPARYDINGVKLGIWVSRQRQLYKNNKLTQERIDKLDSLGIIWDSVEATWDVTFKLLSKYRDEKGHCNVPQGYEADGVKLGAWVSTQRTLFNNNKLTLNKIDKLNSIGFQWDVYETEWNTTYKLLLKYRDEKGHCNVPFKYELDGKKLGGWVHTQRKIFKQNRISQERINKLNSIGFDWSLGSGKRQQAKTQAS